MWTGTFSSRRSARNQIPISLRIPDQPQLSRRRHVARERRCCDDGGTCEVAFAAEAHPVLPVAIEGRDRAFARGRARPGPGRNTGRTTTAGFPLPPRAARWRSSLRRAADRAVRSPAPTPAEPGNTSSGVTRARHALLACAAQDECGLQQIVVPAVGARADHGLREREPLACDLFGRKRVPGTERLRNHRPDRIERQCLVERVACVGAWRDQWIRQRVEPSRAIPRARDGVRARRCRSSPLLRPSCWRSCCDTASGSARRDRRAPPTSPRPAACPTGAAARGRCPCRRPRAGCVR